MHTDLTTRTKAYASTLNRLGWGLMVFFVSFYIVNVSCEVAIYAVETLGNSVVTALIKGVFSPICYMIPFFLGGLFFRLISLRKETERIRYEIRLPAVFPLLILAGFGVITAAAYLNNVLCELIGYSLPDELFTETYDNPYTVVAYMATALAPAFAEEYLFRGVIYGNLRPFGRTQAILISATLFALMHQNVGQIVYTFAAGIVMALMYELTGSIWCGVLYHMINNQMSVIMQVLYYGTFGESIEPLLLMWDILTVILGIAAILVLIFHYRNKNRATPKSPADGGFRLMWDREALPGWAIRKGLVAPGVLTFAIATAATMTFTYLFYTFFY